MKETRNYAFLLDDVLQNNFKYAYDQITLWKLAANKKIIKYKMSDVKHWIYYTPWSDGDCLISVYEVLLLKSKYPDHIKRIKNADLSFPLIVIEDKYDKFGTILDGNHRFAKMIMNNKKFVNIVYFTKDELNKIKIKL